MKPVKTGEPVLGVMVTSRMVHAVLIRADAGSPVVLQRFTRPRNSRQGVAAPALTPAMANLIPELQEELSGSDYTIQFGESGNNTGSDLFLRSEFGDRQGVPGDGTGEAVDKAANFMYELSEILDECRKLGYERPAVAFCAGSSDVAHVELHVLGKEKKSRGRDRAAGKDGPNESRAKAPDRDELVKLLKEQYKGSVEEDRVAFVEMAPAESGTFRYMALVPKADEPVAITLQAMRKQKDERPPNAKLLDAEALLYLGLARAFNHLGTTFLESPTQEPRGNRRERRAEAELSAVTGYTLVVRAGAEDTLLYFLDGNTLKHYESMRSLTAFDSPDTICSRVLLQQDEYGVEEVSRVFLLSEEREGELIDSFRAFFPDAEIRSLRDVIPGLGSQAAGEVQYGALIPAVGAALRLLDLPQYRSAFEDVNLLPQRLIRQRIELPFTWHVLVLSIVLFCTAGFFGARYMLVEQEIAKYEELLKTYPPDLEDADPRVLQARIDSMQAAYNGYMKALAVLDTLLVGSDTWSRSLEDLSRETAAVKGIWVESWTPSAGRVVLSGNATARNRVVQLAERMGGELQALTFSEIREWPVYSFTMLVPLKAELPEAAKYLRELAATNPQHTAASASDSALVAPAAIAAQ